MRRYLAHKSALAALLTSVLIVACGGSGGGGSGGGAGSDGGGDEATLSVDEIRACFQASQFTKGDGEKPTDPKIDDEIADKYDEIASAAEKKGAFGIGIDVEGVGYISEYAFVFSDEAAASKIRPKLEQIGEDPSIQRGNVLLTVSEETTNDANRLLASC